MYEATTPTPQAYRAGPVSPAKISQWLNPVRGENILNPILTKSFGLCHCGIERLAFSAIPCTVKLETLTSGNFDEFGESG